MPIKSQRHDLPVKRRKYTEWTRSIIPDVIRLPDGREVAVKDILTRPRNRRSYNLKTGMEFGQRIRRKIAKPVDNTPEE